MEGVAGGLALGGLAIEAWTIKKRPLVARGQGPRVSLQIGSGIAGCALSRSRKLVGARSCFVSGRRTGLLARLWREALEHVFDVVVQHAVVLRRVGGDVFGSETAPEDVL